MKWYKEIVMKVKKKVITKEAKKICPHCNRPFTNTEVPSGKFCCYACEYGY